MSSTKFEKFSSKVTSRVKSKEVHNMIQNELTSHLEERSQFFQKKTFSKDDADDKAIQEMGNPIIIGDNLNKLHKPKIDWILITLFVIIAGISFLPLIGGSPESIAPSSYFIGKQMIWYIIAVLIIVGGIHFFDYRKLQSLWVAFYVIGLSLLLLVLNFGKVTMGTKRWVVLGDISVDVTLLSLFLFFLAWTTILSRVKEFSSWKKQILLFFLFWTPFFFYMMLLQFVVSIIYFFCILTMIAFSRAHIKLFIWWIVTNVAACLLFIGTIINTFQNNYFYFRLLAFIDRYSDPDGEGYIYFVINDALSKAGWFGNGLDNDLNQQAFSITHTDLAFSYLVFSLGWAFGIFLCFILLVFIIRISLNAFKTKDQFGRLLVIGGAALFTVPTCWNILMGLGIVPIMGVSLPFISYGGSMLLFYATILGLTLNVYRKKDIVEFTAVKI
ncbi:FtsW/RodA/SpoVE family cell cycle protein [Ornithinibacillus salinisoli]|uniref:FtsW/RodA/SpoVE family cell cycle protein n=1 Tax=Ornithinibacillus salinisoli TaxID=1848459 RepID=A0ABW4VYM5_9BACI